VLHRRDLRPLLGRANASPRLGSSIVKEFLQAGEESLQQLNLTPWLVAALSGSAGERQKLLSGWQITGLLARLCTPSHAMTTVFKRYATDGRMDVEQWLTFVRKEQLSHEAQSLQSQVGKEAANSLALERYKHQFEHATHAERAHLGTDRTLSLLQFSLQLLHSDSDAVSPLDGQHLKDDPLAHYWTPCSHNSYIVGDQLTGTSSADAYRRQLLQECRQLEIDCWDGPQQPAVTHGNTFCTVETFEAVAKAIAEHAFTTSTMPVVLSMEMHCSPSQQRRLSNMLIDHLADALLMVG